VVGAVRVEREDGTLIREAGSMALCRCGASREMPFCDGSHRVVQLAD
jgi:CDGSH-type Zn-finger protein